jgi:hypothetical protein
MIKETATGGKPELMLRFMESEWLGLGGCASGARKGTNCPTLVPTCCR